MGWIFAGAPGGALTRVSEERAPRILSWPRRNTRTARALRGDRSNTVSLMADILPPGAEAPDFTLNVTPDQKLSLNELRGQRVVLAFYPADWSPVCGDQMGLYNEIPSEFRERGAELVGLSVDGAWCHKAFAEHRRLHFPLLAD